MLHQRFVAQWTEPGVPNPRGRRFDSCRGVSSLVRLVVRTAASQAVNAGSTPVPDSISTLRSSVDRAVGFEPTSRAFESCRRVHLVVVAEWVGAGLQPRRRRSDPCRRLHLPRVAQSGERPVYTRRHALERSQPWGPSCWISDSGSTLPSYGSGRGSIPLSSSNLRSSSGRMPGC